jgi:HD superfamily phosphohydrolase
VVNTVSRSQGGSSWDSLGNYERKELPLKRIFDPVHQFIELDDAEATLIDTMPMQRLRRLRQLGLAYLAFPGAEHTRFGHALGATAFGSRILDSLRIHSASYFMSDADYHYQRRLLRAALLLHDTGHGPFSHACEHVLQRNHESRTEAVLRLSEIQDALAGLDVDPRQVLALIVGSAPAEYPVLRELVSGPNLDADRMDYLQRDAYFSGVSAGRYDGEQLIASLRVYERNGAPVLGVDGRGVIALEGFVLARYLMFASIYFHHTTRAFERTLHEALHALWPDPAALDPIETYLAWDDFRVIDALRESTSEAGQALRNRQRLYSLIAEYNAADNLTLFDRSAERLREHYGNAVWEDTQEQVMHRLPLGIVGSQPTVFVRTAAGIVDAREASDLIAKLSGKASWRKLYLRRGQASIEEARKLIHAG